MPRVKTSRSAPPPEGFEEIRETLDDFDLKMRTVSEVRSNDNARREEGSWGITRVSHARTRYIYSLYWDREAISRELYDWLLKMGYADAALMAKWKKQGYEKLCCLGCASTAESLHGTVCVCRIPKAKLKEGTVIQCTRCGCRGCASSD